MALLNGFLLIVVGLGVMGFGLMIFYVFLPLFNQGATMPLVLWVMGAIGIGWQFASIGN